ncbi:MAG: hypothetical protein WCY41_05365 [Candidatus Micrarchaeia archaeon]
MANLEWIKEKYIYVVVLALLILMGIVIVHYHSGQITYEDTRVYLEVLTAIATLALLYFAYFNATAKKEEDAAHLELAVRPIFVWELEAKDGGAQIVYKTLKHPIYDFKAALSCAGKELVLNERHLDVFETNPGAERERDVTAFVREALGSKGARRLDIVFHYHSEAGGQYELAFSKDVSRKGRGFLFDHRKFVSAKYPWRAEKVMFDEEE